MRKINKKKVLKKKDGERNLDVPSCTPDVQAALRETRRIEWNKWMKFNAGIILTDPLKWVDTEKDVYLRRDNDYVSVLAKYKNPLVGCGNFETTEGLRTDTPAVDVDSHDLVCSWCAQAHVSIHSCDLTNGYFQGARNRSNLAVLYSS